MAKVSFVMAYCEKVPNNCQYFLEQSASQSQTTTQGGANLIKGCEIKLVFSSSGSFRYLYSVFRTHGFVGDVGKPDLLASSLPVSWLCLIFGQNRKLFISVGDQTLKQV